MTDLVVVGAGIVGASAAYHAARLGADVVLVDKGLPGSGVTGDASGASPGSLDGGSGSSWRRCTGGPIASAASTGGGTNGGRP